MEGQDLGLYLCIGDRPPDLNGFLAVVKDIAAGYIQGRIFGVVTGQRQQLPF